MKHDPFNPQWPPTYPARPQKPHKNQTLRPDVRALDLPRSTKIREGKDER